MDQRLHVSGIVTAAKPGQWVTLQLTDGSVRLNTRQWANLQPGDRISTACWPQQRRGNCSLLDGVMRVTGHHSPPIPAPAPRTLQAAQAATAQLVSVEGLLRNDAMDPSEPKVLTLLPSHGPRWRIRWSTFLKPEQLQALAPGSLVRATGVVQHRADSKDESQLGEMLLIPRSIQDLVVLRPPSFWTPALLRTALTGALGLAVVAAGLAGLFRWQLGRQAQHIRQIEADAIAQEERRRLSREFHDSLLQHLTGAALHVGTLRTALVSSPERAHQLLSDLSSMLRHCHNEARQCIWDLRTDTPANQNLAEALRDWLRMRSAQLGRAELTLKVEGALPKVSQDTALQIMRVAQEAVNNALAHSGADNIDVTLSMKDTQLELRVRDDGTGFDVSRALGTAAGHYGLTSQQERARKLGAALQVESRPGSGTQLQLALPFSTTNHASTAVQS
jgi:signal transduction histidine kinase